MWNPNDKVNSNNESDVEEFCEKKSSEVFLKYEKIIILTNVLNHYNIEEKNIRKNLISDVLN